LYGRVTLAVRGYLTWLSTAVVIATAAGVIAFGCAS